MTMSCEGRLSGAMQAIAERGLAAGNAALSAQNYNQQQAQSANQGVSGQQSPTIIERILHWRRKAQARDQVLEYIEAQLNMDLFKGSPEATALFTTAMIAAAEAISK